MLIETLKLILTNEAVLPKIDNFMSDLYRRVDNRIGSAQTACRNCGRCCDFSSGHLNLFASSLELVCFLRHTESIVEPAAGRCPYRDDRAGCLARGYRLLGCRTYFCAPPTGYDGSTIYEEALAEIKGFLRANALPYFYQEWLNTLQELAHGVSRGTVGTNVCPKPQG